MTTQKQVVALEETPEYQQLVKQYRQDIENMTFAFEAHKARRDGQFNRDTKLLKRIHVNRQAKQS